MDTRNFIQDIIDNELTRCFADCSQDNIDKWVEVLERYKEQLLIHSVVKSFTAEEVVNELKENETLDDAISFFNNQK